MIGYLATILALGDRGGPMARAIIAGDSSADTVGYCLLPTAHFKTSATSRSARSAPGSKVSGR